MDEQIAAVRAALAAVEAAVAQTEAALKTAANPQDVMALTAALVDLRSQRSALQLQLASLEAAAVSVRALRGARSLRSVRGTPDPGRSRAAARGQMKSLEKQLKSAVVDRRVSAATLAFAADVLDKAKTVRMFGDDEEPPTIETPPGKRKSVVARPAVRSAARRRSTP